MKHDNSNQNPWAGLSSYEDPAKSEQKLKFCGRDNETKEVTRLIDDNFFVTLYGKSGIGKTSLLNAGVFPSLRHEQYTPLSLRLGMTDEAQTFQDIITTAIERAIEDCGGSVRVIDVVDEQTDRSAIDYLWNWFARHCFLKADGHATFPVIVFDQFEEVFRHSESRQKTEVLLTQLHYLIDESHALNDCIVNGEQYYYDFNFRFVLSIREDDLYRLEDSIDNCALTALKRCRYRLRSLSEQSAESVILVPGEGLFKEEEQKEIVNTIIEIARNKEDKSISTNVLSLVCNRIFVDFQKTGAGHITPNLVEAFVKGNPFERFYNEATRGFSNKEKSYIEDNLVDSTGRRNSIPESNFLLHVKNGNKLIEGDTRILQRTSTSSDGSNYRVELIHDSFCEPLASLKEKREKKKRQRQMLLIACFTLAVLGGAYAIIHSLNQRQEKMLINQSRFVAEKASALVDEGDSYLARLLAIEALDKSNTPEAEFALRKALQHDNAILRGHTDVINFMEFSPDGGKLVSASEDGTVIVWDYQTGEKQTILKMKSKVYSVNFSPDGNSFLTVSRDDTLRIWNTSTGNVLAFPVNDHIRSAVFSPDGSMVYTVSDVGVFHQWDAQTGKHERPLDHKIMYARKVSISPDGKKIVISGWGWGSIGILDTQTGIEQELPIGHRRIVNSAVFSRDGHYIVSSSSDSTIIIWDAHKNQMIRTLKGHTGAVYSATFSPDGRYVVSASCDSTVRIWDVRSGNEIQSFQGHFGIVNSAVFSPDNKCVVSASADHTVRIWDLQSNQGQQILKIDSFYNYSCVFSIDGKYVAQLTDDCELSIRDSKNGKVLFKNNYSNIIREFIPREGTYLRLWAFNPQSEQIALNAYYGSSIVVLNYSSFASF